MSTQSATTKLTANYPDTIEYCNTCKRFVVSSPMPWPNQFVHFCTNCRDTTLLVEGHKEKKMRITTTEETEVTTTTTRTTKYTYSEGMTDNEKKALRKAARKAAKKAQENPEITAQEAEFEEAFRNHLSQIHNPALDVLSLMAQD